MRDFTAGHIDNASGTELVATLEKSLGGPVKFGGLRGKLEFHAGVSYRNILVYRGADAPFAKETKTQPPHDVPDQLIANHLPKGPGADLLCDIMTKSRDLFRDHPANRRRIAAGKKPATQCWLWGQGIAPTLRSFRDVYGKNAAMHQRPSTSFAASAFPPTGWKRIDVAGASGYLDTDYAAKGRYGRGRSRGS